MENTLELGFSFHESLATPHDPGLPSDSSWQDALKWLPLVEKLARKHQKQNKRRFGMDLDDLIQEGFLGVKRAVEVYDASVGMSLYKHVSLRIWLAMKRAVQEQGNVIYLPSKPYTDAHRLRHNILDESKLSPGRVQCAHQANMVRYENIASNSSDSGHMCLYSIPTVGDWDATIEKMDLENSLGSLSPEEQFVIMSYFQDRPLSWERIASKMGTCRRSVNKIRDRAFEKLRDSLYQKDLKHAS